ncbi:MAG: NHL repeat-containing protein [Planctomycetota bacterium]
MKRASACAGRRASSLLLTLFLLLASSLNCSTAFAQDGSEKAKPVLSPELPLYPLDLAVAGDGTVYVVDLNLHGVWRWKDGELSVLFEGSPQYRTPLNAPRCIAIDVDGSVLVGDSATREIYRFDKDGKPQPITNGKIGVPMDLAVAKDGTIYVADLELRRLFRIPPGTGDVEEVAKNNPRGVSVDAKGQIWVVSQDKEQLQVLGSDGSADAVVSTREFQFPHQVAVLDDGTALVTDGYAKALWRVKPDGKPEKVLEGKPLDNPVGITRAGDDLMLVDPRVRKVFRIEVAEDGSLGELQEVFEVKR